MSNADLGDLQAVVDDLVRSGRYPSEAEVLREGVRLVQEREAELAEFLQKIDEGLIDAEEGRTFPADEVFAELRARVQARLDARR